MEVNRYSAVQSLFLKNGPDASAIIDLNILFCNVNGRCRFLNDPTVHKWVSNFNVMFISEAHLTKGQKFVIEGYIPFPNSFSKPTDRKPRGGLSCFIHNEVMKFVNEVYLEYDSHILVLLKGGHRIFGSYVPPSFLTPTDSTFSVIGGGDFNSCVGVVSHLPPINGSYCRINPDETIHFHGKMLKKICKVSNFYIINNLTTCDNDCAGHFTFSKCNRKSQNDICLSNTSGLLNLDIHDIPFNFSDHCPISLSGNLTSKEEALPRLVSEDLLSQPGMRAPKRPKQLRNGDVNWEAFKNSANINLRKIQSNMCNYNLQSQ